MIPFFDFDDKVKGRYRANKALVEIMDEIPRLMDELSYSSYFALQ